jgi:hypothetical protein
MGPWYLLTWWPAIWWNLNIQLAYWPVYTGNRLDLGSTLRDLLIGNLDALTANVPEPWRHDSAALPRVTSYDCVGAVAGERGNLVWACHNLWWQHRFAGDDVAMVRELIPLLSRR